ncbi:MAG: hypothetical protein EZS28_015431 [Streblomastix strix]|uniref:Uncharacterized protein n=1 Tax=Streblomastix strix TaxID=222440 RepID=A0A5J4W312_9EUKA|nr:MAG: hypothetical protein EZS28_015431 [Streblomastix strix]
MAALRAKLYGLDANANWIDLGTGWSTIEDIHIIVRFDTFSARLHTSEYRVRIMEKTEDYQKEGGIIFIINYTLILFTDEDTCEEYGLSFLTKDAREQMWGKIMEEQSKPKNILPQIGKDTLNDIQTVIKMQCTDPGRKAKLAYNLLQNVRQYIIK